jgi:hypothetical protein
MSCLTVLAISVLAAGYYKPSITVDYLASLNNLKGAISGVSNEQQASEMFKLFMERL